MHMTLDTGTATAIGIIISAVGGVIVRVVLSVRREVLDQVAVVSEKTDVAIHYADKAKAAAETNTIKTDMVGVTLDNITNVTTASAKNIDGNLTKVTEKLASMEAAFSKQVAINETLKETNTALINILSSQRTMRNTDVPATNGTTERKV